MRIRYSSLFACTTVAVAAIAAACGDENAPAVIVPPEDAATPSDAAGADTTAEATVDATPDAAPDAAPEAEAAATVTFTQVYTTVITQFCAPCHTAAGGIGITTGNLDMTTQAKAFTNLVNVPAAGASCSGMGVRIVPGSPATSLLFKKVDLTDPAPCGSKMPLGLPPLSQANIDLIGAWITAGAQNN
jgi:hypothetical protein